MYIIDKQSILFLLYKMKIILNSLYIILNIQIKS